MIAPPFQDRVLGSPDANFVVMEVHAKGEPQGQPHRLVPLHVHHHDDEAIYVLEGLLFVRLGDGDVETRAGSGVFIPHGTPHTYWNPAAGPVRFLNVMTPRIFLLIQELNILQQHTQEAVAKIYEKCASAMLEPLLTPSSS